MTELVPPNGFATAELIFDDQFTESSLNTSYWHPWLGNATYGRWGNNGNLPSPYSAFNAGTVTLNYDDPYPYGGATNTGGNHLVGGNGALSLSLSPSSYFSSQGYTWAGAEVSSYGLVSLPATGGYVQWQAQMPNSDSGAWGGLWMLSQNGAEMDVQESGYLSGSANPNDVLASHWQGSGGSQIIQNTGIDLSAGYNTYGIEYIPGQSWTVYLNGKEMAQWTTGVPTNASYELLMGLDMAAPSTAGWHTTANSANPGPFTMNVQDVQVYSLPPGTTTPSAGGSSSGSSGSSTGSSSGSTGSVSSGSGSTGSSTGSDPATVAPSVPSGWRATMLKGSQVDLQWTASTDPSSSVYGYDVYRNGSYLGFSATPSYDDNTVTAGTSYQYQVLAYNPQHQTSALSSPLTVIAGTLAPSVPTGLSATLASSTQIDLSWTVSTDPSSSVYGYEVYRNGSYLGSSATASYDDKTVTAGTSYQYQVLAYNPQDQTSALSSPLTTTAGTSPPSVPTGLSATLASSTQIDLSWTASTDPSSSVYGYDVYRNGNYLGFSYTPSYDDSSVTAGASYQYQVLAYDPQDQTSALSSAFTVVAGNPSAPSVPTGLTATLATSRQIDLKWNASTDPGSSVYGYDVYRNGSYLGFSATPSYDDTRVKGATSYRYQVLAYNPEHHASALSSPLTVSS